MKTCRFCAEIISDQDKICGNCGYNPQTDTMTASFVKKQQKSRKGQKQNLVSSGVKSFAWWGMVVVVISLGIKYQGKLGDVAWRAKNILLGDKVNKSAKTAGKGKPQKITRLIDVRSHQAAVDKIADKNIRIEGIFYDPQVKSCVVINGQLVSEGESFRNMLIKKINRDSVEVVQDGQEMVLRVSK